MEAMQTYENDSRFGRNYRLKNFLLISPLPILGVGVVVATVLSVVVELLFPSAKYTVICTSNV